MTLSAVIWVTTLPVAILLALALSGRGRPLPRALLGAAGVVAVLGLTGDGVALARQWALSGWQRVPALVVMSERGERRNDWRFQYEYEVLGQRFTGSRLTFSPHTRSREDTDALAAHFSQGKEIEIAVDPDDPGNAVVFAEPSYRLPVSALVIHGLLVAAIIRRIRGRQEPPAVCDGAGS